MRNRVIDRSDFMTQQISDRVIVQSKETGLGAERGWKFDQGQEYGKVTVRGGGVKCRLWKSFAESGLG